ncbi:MAG: alpha/beta hydrolase [Cyclobacteriaceae bacterium]
MSVLENLDYSFIDNHSEKTIILIPDVYYDYSFYSEIIDSVPLGYNFLFFNLPGFGTSVCDRNFDLHDTVEVVETLVSNLGLKKVILFGHGYGVNVALRYNDASPEDTCAMILCSGSKIPVHHLYKEAILGSINHYYNGDISLHDFTNILRENNFTNIHSEKAKQWTEHLISLDKDALMAQTQATLSAGTLVEKLDVNRLRRVLIIHGESDRIYSPECSEKLSIEIETCTLHILKGKSHALFEDDQIVEKYINPFIDKL